MARRSPPTSRDLPVACACPGANRRTDDGKYFETVTPVTHGGRPLASR